MWGERARGWPRGRGRAGRVAQGEGEGRQGGPGEGEVIPIGASHGIILMGGSGPRRWGRHAVTKPHQGKRDSHGCTSWATMDQMQVPAFDIRSITEANCPIMSKSANPTPPPEGPTKSLDSFVKQTTRPVDHLWSP